MVNAAGPVGVLAVQGDFAAHVRAVEKAGYRAVEVRRAEAVPGLSALILPGGESTTMLKFLAAEGLDSVIKEFAANRGPILATCAGVILLAKEVTNPEQVSLGVLDIGVVRIGYGRQVHSVISAIAGPPALGDLEAFFIRAPRITRLGRGVEVLARWEDDPVLIRQQNIVAATFHPELTAIARMAIDGMEATRRSPCN